LHLEEKLIDFLQAARRRHGVTAGCPPRHAPEQAYTNNTYIIQEKLMPLVKK
jgi:hypothetical protein